MISQTATLTALCGVLSTSEQLEMKLIETIQNEDAEMFDRLDSCRQLGTVGGKQSIEPLATLLHGDERLAHMALYGLLTNPDPAVDEALRKAMDGAEGRNLMGIINVLGERRDEKAADSIAKHLKSSNKQVSEFAARALGRIGSDKACEALDKALDDSDIADHAVLYEGALRCANHAEETNKKVALSIYEKLQKEDAPDYVTNAAKEGAKRVQ